MPWLFLHSNSLVHLDLKPGNILLNSSHSVSHRTTFTSGPTKYDLAKICDFGLSKDFKQNTAQLPGTRTRSSTTVKQSTPLFMAPEILFVAIQNDTKGSQKFKSVRQTIRGTRLDVMHNLLKLDTKLSVTGTGEFQELCKTDVYAFGIILAMMCYPDLYKKEESAIASRMPNSFGQARESALLEQIEKGMRPSLPDCLPTSLVSVIKKAWSQDPNDRPTPIALRSMLSKLEKEAMMVSDIPLQLNPDVLNSA